MAALYAFLEEIGLPGQLQSKTERLRKQGELQLADEYHVLSDDVIATLSGIDWQSRMGQILEAVTSGVGDVVDVVLVAVSDVLSGIVTGFLALIFALSLIPCGHGLLEPGSQGAGAGLFGAIGLFHFEVSETRSRSGNGRDGCQTGERVGLHS